MIYQTKAFDPTTSINRIKKAGYTLTPAAVAADIRHNYTNYDDLSVLLSTDQAEELIIATVNAVTAINKALKPAMITWAKDKMKGLI